MDPNLPEKNLQPPSVPPQGVVPPILLSQHEEEFEIYREDEWIRLHRKRAQLGILLGLVFPIAFYLFFSGVLFSQTSFSPGLIYSVLEFIFSLLGFYGFGLFTWGCQGYAMSKGYSPAIGYIGLFMLWGLLVLLFLPQKLPVQPPWRGYFKPPLIPFRLIRNKFTD